MTNKIKCFSIFSLLLIFFNTSLIPVSALKVNAQEENSEKQEVFFHNMVYSKTQKEFIENVEANENISVKDKDVNTVINPDNTVTITVVNDDGFDIFSSENPVIPRAHELKSYNNEDHIAPAALPTVLRGIVYLYKIYSTGKNVCQVLERFSNGQSPCAVISQAVKDNLSTTRKTKYQVTRHFKKLSCPYPPNSYQCSSPPYGYWTTSVKKI